MKSKLNPPIEENNDQEPKNPMKENTYELPKTIGLDDTCKLLVLPEPIVLALSSSGLIQDHAAKGEPMMSLDDVITVSTVLNRYRDYHADVLACYHNDSLWELLVPQGPDETESLTSAKPEGFNSESDTDQLNMN